MIERVLQIFQDVLPLDQLNWVLHVVKQERNLLPIDAVPLAFQLADLIIAG